MQLLPKLYITIIRCAPYSPRLSCNTLCLLTLYKTLFPCMPQPIENQPIPLKCFVVNSWNRWALANEYWRELFMFRIRVSWSIKSCGLHRARHYDWQSSMYLQFMPAHPPQMYTSTLNPALPLHRSVFHDTHSVRCASVDRQSVPCDNLCSRVR